MRARRSKAVSIRPSSAERQHRPAENDDRGIDAAEQEGAAAHASRDRVQHREAEHAIGHQQARRQHAGDDADRARRQNSGRRRRRAARRSVWETSWPESCGHGRFSSPENFTMRAASHRLTRLVMVATTAAAGGTATTRKSTSRSIFFTPGTAAGLSAPSPVSARSTLHQRIVQAGAEAFRVAAEIRDRHHHHQRGEDRGPDHQPAGRIPFERRVAPAPPGRRARQHREIAEPPGGDSRRRRGTQRRRPRRTPRPVPIAPASAAINAAQWLQPSAGDQDRQRREIKQRDRQAMRRTRPTRTAKPPRRPRQFR